MKSSPAETKTTVDSLKTEFDKEIDSLEPDLSHDLERIEKLYKDVANRYLGRDSKLTQILRGIKDLDSADDKKLVGNLANQFRMSVEGEIERSVAKATKLKLDRQLGEEAVDPTRPGIKGSTSRRGDSAYLGKKHILTQTVERIEDIFLSMGFAVEYSYDVDNAYNAFDALNIEKNHPARDNWDTLWLNDGNLAIPHTSSMQNRIMRASKELPVRSVVIGKTYRNEATDARHEHTFMQVEGIYLNNTANMAEMLGVLLAFFEEFFGKKLEHKFSPDYFPFVEPGGQLAIECVVCNKTGCSLCKGSKYLEVLGCGMIHPKVISEAGKNPSECSGFAWGFGLERILMIREAIGDIRYFHSGDLRFINQF